MTDLRTAAQQALEVLESVEQNYGNLWHINKSPEELDELCVLLRAALAQPQQEPVAWGMRNDDGQIYDCIAPQEHARLAGDYTVPLYTAPQPAAWVGLSLDDCKDLCAGRINANDLTLIRAVEDSLREKNGGAHGDTALLRQALEALEAAEFHAKRRVPDASIEVAVAPALAALRERLK